MNDIEPEKRIGGKEYDVVSNKVANIKDHICRDYQLPEQFAVDKQVTKEEIDKLRYEYESLNTWTVRYKELVANTDKALKTAQTALETRKKTLEAKLLEFFTTPRKTIKRVGEIEREFMELPTIKYDHVQKRTTTKYSYDNEVLLNDARFVKMKPTLDKMAARKAYAADKGTKGIKSYQETTIKISTETKGE